MYTLEYGLKCRTGAESWDTVAGCYCRPATVSSHAALVRHHPRWPAAGRRLLFPSSTCHGMALCFVLSHVTPVTHKVLSMGVFKVHFNGFHHFGSNSEGHSRFFNPFFLFLNIYQRECMLFLFPNSGKALLTFSLPN